MNMMLDIKIIPEKAYKLIFIQILHGCRLIASFPYKQGYKLQPVPNQQKNILTLECTQRCRVGWKGKKI
jgi:hypothetical protein